jgi:hypothetical protein
MLDFPYGSRGFPHRGSARTQIYECKPILMRPGAAQLYIDVTPTTYQRLVRQGVIKTTTVGGRELAIVASLDALADPTTLTQPEAAASSQILPAGTCGISARMALREKPRAARHRRKRTAPAAPHRRHRSRCLRHGASSLDAWDSGRSKRRPGRNGFSARARSCAALPSST